MLLACLATGVEAQTSGPAPAPRRPALREAPAAAEGFVDRAGKWPNQTIWVCWEGSEPAFAAERAWVKSSVQEALSGYRTLAGWGDCRASDRQIRIRRIDETAPADRYDSRSPVGRQAGGPTVVFMNFTFGRWGAGCAEAANRERCVRVIAVHEMFHALGVLHEQNRDDVPDTCKHSRVEGDVNPPTREAVGPFCEGSIMNYCTVDRSGRAIFDMYVRNWDARRSRVRLADCDHDALRALYR